MTLAKKILLVKALIRENPDIELWEYLAAVQQIEAAERIRTDLAAVEPKIQEIKPPEMISSEDPIPNSRPKAEYSNRSPWGIASDLNQAI